MSDGDMLIPLERIRGSITQLRRERVMLDVDLAMLTGWKPMH